MIRKLLAVFVGLGLLGAAFATFDSDAFGLKKFVSVTSGSQPRSVTNQVAARELSLVCPGAAYTESSSSGLSASFAPLGLAEVGVNQNSVSKFFAASSPTVVKASANDAGLPQGSALLSANQTQAFKAAAKGFAAGANGLLAADCVRPSSDFWFLGASTAVGRQAILIVNNPSAVDSTFNLEIFDEGGLVTAPGMQGLSVAAGKPLVLPLAAFATRSDACPSHFKSGRRRCGLGSTKDGARNSGSRHRLHFAFEPTWQTRSLAWVNGNWFKGSNRNCQSQPRLW